MSKVLKKIIEIKSSQKKFEMLEAWNEKNRVEKRCEGIEINKQILTKKYASLNDGSREFSNAEVNEIAITQAERFASDLEALEEEKISLLKKRVQLEKKVNIANALSEAYQCIGDEISSSMEKDKTNKEIECEMYELIERVYGHSNRQ